MPEDIEDFYIPDLENGKEIDFEDPQNITLLKSRVGACVKLDQIEYDYIVHLLFKLQRAEEVLNFAASESELLSHYKFEELLKRISDFYLEYRYPDFGE